MQLRLVVQKKTCIFACNLLLLSLIRRQGYEQKKTINENMEWLKITTNSEIIRFQPMRSFSSKAMETTPTYSLPMAKENVISQLHDLMDKLTALNYSPFYRVGKSLIINRDYIFKVNPGLQRIILSNSRLKRISHQGIQGCT